MFCKIFTVNQIRLPRKRLRPRQQQLLQRQHNKIRITWVTNNNNNNEIGQQVIVIIIINQMAVIIIGVVVRISLRVILRSTDGAKNVCTLLY